MVDDMAAAGLVERRADPADGRRKLLALTADGRRVRATALGVSAALEAEVGPPPRARPARPRCSG